MTTIKVNVNMSREVADYFKDYNLSQILNDLCQRYDFTNMPPMMLRAERIERKVEITDPYYISMYDTLGARSKKVSLGRLLEFAYNLDILSNTTTYEKVDKVDKVDNLDNLDKALRALCTARKYLPDDLKLEELIEEVENDIGSRL